MLVAHLFSRFAMRLTSMALDPTASDFGERINGVPPETIQQLRNQLTKQNALRPSQDEPSVDAMDVNHSSTEQLDTPQTRQQSFWSAFE